MVKRNIQTALSKGEVLQLRCTNKIHVLPFLPITANLPLFAFDNAFDCTGDALQRKQTRRQWRVLSEKTNASPCSHLRSLLRVTVVRGARNTFTTDNTTRENIRHERNKLEARVEMKNDVDERGIKAALFSPFPMRYL